MILRSRSDQRERERKFYDLCCLVLGWANLCCCLILGWANMWLGCARFKSGYVKVFQDKIKLVKKYFIYRQFFSFPNTPWTIRNKAMVHYLQSLLAVGVKILFSFSPQKKGSIQFCDTLFITFCIFVVF